MSDNDLSYCELRSKEVVNDTDGRRMGRIVDILFSRDDGRISGIVVPLNRRGIFSKNQDVFVPWHCVRKIGEDVILVSLTMEADGSLSCGHRPPPPPRPKPPKDCKHGGGYESCGCGDNTLRRLRSAAPQLRQSLRKVHAVRLRLQMVANELTEFIQIDCVTAEYIV